MPAVVSCAIVVGTIRNVIRDQRSSRRLVLPFRKLIRPPSLASHNVVVYLPSVLQRCAALLAARRNVYSTQGKLRQTDRRFAESTSQKLSNFLDTTKLRGLCHCYEPNGDH